MTNITIDAGTLMFSADDDMTATGLLVPYGVEASSNLGRFTVDTGVFSIPADLTGMSLNVEHAREAVVGAFTRAWETAEGMFASYRFASTPEGIKARDAARSGERACLSAEVAGVKIRAGKAVAGTLFASALCKEPAFPGATLLASAPDTGDDDDPETPDPSADDETPDPSAEESGQTIATYESSSASSSAYDDGSEYSDATTTTEEVIDLGDGRTRTIRTSVTTYESAPAAQEPTTEGTAILTNSTPPAAPAAPAAVPGTLLASAPAAPAETNPRALDVDRGTLFAAMSAVRSGAYSADDLTLLAALGSVTMGGGGASQLPAAGSAATGGVLRPNWLGQLYDGEPYERQYLTLHALGTDISAAGKAGYKINRGPNEAGTLAHLDGDWAGNKSDIKSGSGWTKTFGSTFDRYAIGNDIGREFYDLPGGAEVVEAFVRLLVEDYYYWSDEKGRALIVATAGAPIAPATAKFSTKYPAAVGMAIQGILAVKRRKADGRRDTPTYAIANAEAYEDMAYAAGGEENLPAFISLAVTTASNGTIDGNVQIIEGENGIEDTAAVTVGARRAIEFDELPGGPLQIDALELAKGGIDRAVHGYLQKFVVRPEAIVTVGVADA